MSPAGELHPDLVGAPGMQTDTDTAAIPGAVYNAVIKLRLLNALTRVISDEGHATCLITPQQVTESCGMGRYAMHYSQVFLLEFILPNLAG